MVVGRVRQVVVLCNVNTTKYYLGRLLSGRYGEVVFKTGSTVETNPLICLANQWTGFCMIWTSVMKELKSLGVVKDEITFSLHLWSCLCFRYVATVRSKRSLQISLLMLSELTFISFEITRKPMALMILGEIEVN